MPPDAVGQPLERRHLTVVFADLIGSSELSASLDAEKLQHLLQRYHGECAKAVTEHGGYVAQYLGDGMLAYFGFPSAHEDDARRAIAAGQAVCAAVERLNRELGQLLRVRVGVHTGPVVMGDLGSPDRRERLAVGEAVNIASRVQQLARPDTVVMTGATVRLVEGYFALHTLGPRELRGFDQPIEIFEARGESGARDRIEIASRTGLTPYAGSRAAIELLIAGFERARSGESAVMLLIGEAGVGKSRCLLATREELASGPHAWLACRCVADRQKSTLFPLVELLQSRLGAAASGTAEERMTALRALLPGDANEQLAYALARLLFIPHEASASHVELGPPRLSQITFEAVLAFLEHVEADKPRVLVIEDLHWADPTTLELLGLLAQRAPRGLLTIATSRAELPILAGVEKIDRVPLERLPPEASASIVRSLADGRSIPQTVIQQVLARADGLPLFIEEIARAVLQSGQLRIAGDALELVAPLHALEVPPTLRETVAARLDRLGEHRSLAQVAAVLGRHFDRDLLAAAYQQVTQASREQLDAGITALIELRLIEPAERPNELAFRHAMIHEVAYLSLSTATRQFYHRKIALHLTAQGAAESAPEQLAHHCAQAGLPQQALQHYAFMGERALSAGSFREGAAAFESALAQLSRLPESADRDTLEMNLCAALGLAVLATEGFSAPGVERAYRRGLELTERHMRSAPRLLYGMWAFHMLRGNVTETGRIVPLYEQMVATSSDPLEQLVANASLASRAYFRGRYEEALPAFDRALSHYDLGNAREQNLALIERYGFESYVHAPMFRAWTHLFTGRIADSDRDVALVMQLAESCQHAYTRCSALGFLAPMAHDRGDVGLASRHADELIGMSQQHGFVYWLGSGLIVKGWTLAMQGAVPEGLGLLEQGLEIFKLLGARLTYAYYLSYRVEALLIAERVEEARAVAEEALRMGEDGLNAMFVPELRRLKGEALHRLGQSAAAKRELQLSLATTQAQGVPLLSLRAAISLHDVLAGMGQTSDGRARVEDALAAMPEGIALPEGQRAKAILQ
jgi:class 3 adenylate cyclase/predicted ATPase